MSGITVTWSEKRIIKSQTLYVNGAPQYTLQTNRSGWRTGEKTGLLDARTGQLLGEIDWKSHGLTVGNRSTLTNDIKRKKDGFSWRVCVDLACCILGSKH